MSRKGFPEEGGFRRGRCLMYVAECSGRRSGGSKRPKAGRRRPAEKHQVIKFKYGQGRDAIRRVFWGQAVESPNARPRSSCLIQWSAGSHWRLLSRRVAFLTAVPG